MSKYNYGLFGLGITEFDSTAGPLFKEITNTSKKFVILKIQIEIYLLKYFNLHKNKF